MKYTSQELAFILYNNRSVSGVVNNFIGPVSFEMAQGLAEIDNRLEWCQEQGGKAGSTVGIPMDELLVDADDIVVTPADLDGACNFSDVRLEDRERHWLESRGITGSMMEDWGMFSASSVGSSGHDALGLTCHPVLRGFLADGLDEGCVCIPLMRERDLVNCTSRRLSDVGKLKYVQAVPDVDVWGLVDPVMNDIEHKHAYITEGLFDMMAIRETGRWAVSVSGAMWSSIQVYKLLKKNPEMITIFADNDRTGLYSAWVLRKLFSMYGVPTNIVVSREAKDPAEHFLQRGLGWEEVDEIDPKRQDFQSLPDQTFNFVKYLKDRRF
jgi:hypothetical protein